MSRFDGWAKPAVIQKDSATLIEDFDELRAPARRGRCQRSRTGPAASRSTGSPQDQAWFSASVQQRAAPAAQLPGDAFLQSPDPSPRPGPRASSRPAARRPATPTCSWWCRSWFDASGRALPAVRNAEIRPVERPLRTPATGCACRSIRASPDRTGGKGRSKACGGRGPTTGSHFTSVLRPTQAVRARLRRPSRSFRRTRNTSSVSARSERQNPLRAPRRRRTDRGSSS